MTRHLEHKGIIRSIDGDILKVGIIPMTTCGACQEKDHCPVADSASEKIIDVAQAHGCYAVGDQVTVLFEKAQAVRALWIGYLIPFLIFIMVLWVMMELFRDEIIAGLCALGSFIPYYTGVYFSREKLKQTFIFRLKEF